MRATADLSYKTNMGEDLPLKIRWSALEHEYHKKNSEWYWTLGIITAAMILAAVILRNFLFAVFSALAGFSIALHGTKIPKNIEAELNPGGVRVGRNEYDYDRLSHFWVDYNPPIKKALIFESKRNFSPRVIILLNDADPEQIRRYLLQYLKEKKIEESLIDSLVRILKF